LHHLIIDHRSTMNTDRFALRHIGPRKADLDNMLETIGVESIDELIFETVPAGIRDGYYAVLLQYPGASGKVNDYAAFAKACQEQQIKIAVAADILSLVVLESPGHWGADVVVGTTQRFGIPLGYGGPHAAYFATREAFKRQIPGRIIGVTIDMDGKRAMRMALQTREQHIKRDKATSNICTAQVLLAVMAGMYGVYHGPRGLKYIANKVHAHAATLADAVEQLGVFPLSRKRYKNNLPQSPAY